MLHKQTINSNIHHNIHLNTNHNKLPVPQIVVIQKDNEKSPYQYAYNLPEKQIYMDCPYCKQGGLSKISYRFNWCCTCLLVWAIFNFITTIIFLRNLQEWFDKIYGPGRVKLNYYEGIIGVIFWAIMFYLSRAFIHQCGGCGRELGRGKPECGCCTASID